MKRWGVGLVTLVVVYAGGVAWQQTRPVTDCQTTVVLDGTVWTPVSVADEVPAGQEVGTAREQGCDDAGPYDVPVALTEIPGIDPADALSSPVAEHTVYLSAGTALEEVGLEPDPVADLMGDPNG